MVLYDEMIVSIIGQNELEKQQKIRSLITEFTKTHGDSVEHFDASELESVDIVVDAVRSISFLDPRKLVVVRSVEQSKEILEQCAEIVAQTAASTDLIVEVNIDKRTSVYKLLKSSTEFHEYIEHNIPELTTWCNDYIDQQGGNSSDGAMKHLVEMAGTNQLRLKNEMDKLLLSKKDITKDLVDEMVEAKPQSKIFAMLDELFKGNSAKAWELYEEQRAQGQEPQKIIAMLTWQLQQLAQAVFSKEKSVDALQSLGMSYFSAQKNLQLSRSVTKNQIRQFISSLAEIDYTAKTRAIVEPALAVYFSELAISS